MGKVVSDHTDVKESVSDEDYILVEGESHLHCTICGQEVEMLHCKCGKFGTRTYMEAHIAGRHAKGTPDAIAAHQVLEEQKVPPVVVPARQRMVGEEREPATYTVVEGARKTVRSHKKKA